MNRLKPAPTPLLLLALWALLCACSEAEQESASLWIGEVEIPASMLDAEVDALAQSFRVEGRQTLRRHLLMNGMGVAALLHHRLAEESKQARDQAQAVFAGFEKAEDFEAVYWMRRESSTEIVPPVAAGAATPHALGASVAAAVALLEPGEWSGPLKTDRGWELVLLRDRVGERRDLGLVELYRIEFPVGGDMDLRQAEEDWSTLPLTGPPELIRCLPPSFRHGRDTP